MMLDELNLSAHNSLRGLRGKGEVPFFHYSPQVHNPVSYDVSSIESMTCVWTQTHAHTHTHT